VNIVPLSMSMVSADRLSGLDRYSVVIIRDKHKAHSHIVFFRAECRASPALLFAFKSQLFDYVMGCHFALSRIIKRLYWTARRHRINDRKISGILPLEAGWFF
jgi:hypothetical protein